MNVNFSNAMGVHGLDREYVTPETKAKYDELLKKIQSILAKGSYSAEDAQALSAALQELKSLQDKGLETGMNDELKLLFLFFSAAGATPENKFSLNPTTIEALRSIKLNIGDGRTLTLDEVILSALDPIKHGNATKKVGDMLLDLARTGYDLYMKKLEDLKQQVDIASQVIKQLQAIQQFLNKVKVKYPDDFKLIPDNLDQIPEELKKVLREKYGKTDEEMIEWIKKNPAAYANECEAYFKKELGIEPNLTPEDVLKLLATRDDLRKQLEAMEKAGADKSEGTPYDTIKKVLDDLNAKFPLDKYPPGKEYTLDKLFPPSNDSDRYRVEYWVKRNPDGSYSYYKRIWDYDEKLGKWTSRDAPISEKDFLFFKGDELNKYWNDTLLEPGKKYISEGFGKGINDALDRAIQANQHLSSKLSDEMKAQNLALQQLFDILVQICKEYRKTVDAPIHNIFR